MRGDEREVVVLVQHFPEALVVAKGRDVRDGLRGVFRLDPVIVCSERYFVKMRIVVIVAPDTLGRIFRQCWRMLGMK